MAKRRATKLKLPRVPVPKPTAPHKLSTKVLPRKAKHKRPAGDWD